LSGADALFARALALEDAGRPEEALERYREVLAHAQQHADAWHNHGLLLAKLGRFAEAEASHRRYLHHCPDSARARSNLADVALALDRPEEALEHLDWIIEHLPADVPALVRHGVALACLGRFADAREAFRFVRTRYPVAVSDYIRRLMPGVDESAVFSPENIYLARRWMAQGQCNWRDWERYVETMRHAGSAPGVMLEPAIGFMSQHMPLSDAERHAIMGRIAEPIEAALPSLAAPVRRQRERIRVGVMSPDFREHLNAYLLRPLFELADRKRFELYAYSLMPDDGGPARARIRAAADEFRDLHALPDKEAALAIRRDDVDILVDVGGHTTGGRFAITAQRPARVQVNYLGFPSSLGSGRIDYAIVDKVAAPDGASWSESLIHLPSTFFLYDYRAAPQPPAVSRREYGLPDGAFVFCAFHKAEKITPECFFLWMEILRNVPQAVLWLIALPAAAAANLRREAARSGVDSARLVFAPFESRERYLARQRLGDLMLDASNHSAMTTACDALGMGLPLLTFGGGTAFANRGGESILRAADMPELVAVDRDAYLRMAVSLASDQVAMGVVRDRLQRCRKSAPLFDTAGRVRELETVLERML
jgi:protein O-GlcNAc transferase